MKNTYVNFSLFDLFIKAKSGDKEAKLKIIETFKPTIEKYAAKLGYEEAKSDLIVELLELIYKLDFDGNQSLSENGIIVKYIWSSLKNEYIKLFRKNDAVKEAERSLDEQFVFLYKVKTDDADILSKIILKESFYRLTKKQALVLYASFIGFRDSEIAKKYNMSKQDVYRTKKSAKQKLKHYYL